MNIFQNKRKKTEMCPICSGPINPETSPFCSLRCKDVDLNRWLSGNYAVPGEPVPENEISALDNAPD